MVRQQDSPLVRADSAAVPVVLGSTLALGLFAVLAPAAASAGPWLVAGIPLAVVLAGCRAFAASIADHGPRGDYACVRAQLGVFPARVSGFTWLAAHVAGAAAVAGTIADHLAPGGSGGVATALLVLAALAITAEPRIPGDTAWWWVAVLVALCAVLVACAFAVPPVAAPPGTRPPGSFAGGVTAAAGVLFFAFLGAERLARPGSGVSRAVPRRISLVLGAVAASMFLLSTALLHQLGAPRLALSPTPALDLLGAADASALRSAVSVGVAFALMPLLPWLLGRPRAMAGAMAADRELPSAIRKRRGVLELVSALMAAGLAWWWQPTAALGLAACCLLVHCAFALVGARLTAEREGRRGLSVLWVGTALAVVFAVSMPVPALFGTLGTAVGGPLIAGVVTGRWR